MPGVMRKGVIGLTAAKDLREMRRDARLVFTLAVCVTLILTASIGGWRHYQTVTREKAQAAGTERSRWLQLGQYNPHGAAHYGMYVFKAHSLLAAFDPGIEEFLGVSVWLEAHKQNDFVYRPVQDVAPVQRFSRLTPATVLQILGPLVIILLGFNAFAGEREQGTLRQTLSLGIDGRRVLAGKAAAIGGVLCLVLAPVMAVALFAGLQASPDAPILPWRRLCLLALVYLVYLGGFVGLTLAVSMRARTARAALAFLLALWTTNGFLVPRMAAEFAEWIHPLPSAIAWRAGMEAEMRDGHAAASEETVRKALLGEHRVAKEEDLPVNWRGVMLQRGEEQNYPVFDAHFGRLFDRIRQQDAVYQWAGLAAPLLALQALSMGLAASDFEHHRCFVRAAEDHRRIIQKTVNAELTLHPETDWGDYQAGPELWARVPEFRYEGPSWRILLGYYTPAVLVLGAWFTAAWWAAFYGAKRMKP